MCFKRLGRDHLTEKMERNRTVGCSSTFSLHNLSPMNQPSSSDHSHSPNHNPLHPLKQPSDPQELPDLSPAPQTHNNSTPPFTEDESSQDDEQASFLSHHDDMEQEQEEEFGMRRHRRNPSEMSYLEEPFFSLVWRRSIVLVVLLFFQSSSSFVLDFFERLLKDNFFIMLFLSMILGAGGNAGSQTVVFIIKGLATGEMHMGNIVKVWKRELRMAAMIVLIVGGAGFLRVFVSEVGKLLYGIFFGQSVTGDETEGAIVLASGAHSLLMTLQHTATVVVSLALVIFTSVVIGMVLPVLFYATGLDPVHSSPILQVIMDLLGVIITCLVASIMLPSGDGE